MKNLKLLEQYDKISDRPRVIHQTHDGSGLLYLLEIPEESIFFKGHFNGLPLLPGVVQIHWACQLSYPITGIIYTNDIKRIKFSAPIFPGDQVQLKLGVINLKELTFQYATGKKIHSQGIISYETR